MAYEFYLSPPAEREFAKLERAVQKQIFSVFEAMHIDPFALDSKKLRKPLNGYRVRKGDYRVLFMIEGKTIIIYSIKNRKDAYR